MREANVILDILSTTANAYIILLLVTSTTEYFVLIVCTFYRLPDIEVAVVTIVCCTNFIKRVCKVIRIKSLDQLCNLLVAKRSIEVYLCLTLRTALGCNDDNTISTTGTIDSCRRSILQYVDALNFAWSDVADRAYRETVNDVEWRVVLRKRTTTTHANLHVSIR